MRRLEHPTEPTEFKQAIVDILSHYPPALNCTENTRWEAFRNTYQDAFLAVRDRLELNQEGICAYCEIKLRDTNKQIEHFIPKSLTTESNDLTFSFSNMLLCCVGGTNKHSRQPGEFSKKPNAMANYSCGEKKGDADPGSVCLSPHNLPNFPVFKASLSDRGINFAPDEDACRRADIEPALVQSTLDFLNLNCPRLSGRREAIWEALEKEIAEILAVSNTQHDIDLESIAKRHLKDDPSFYTTKLLCLADFIPHLIP